MLERSLSPIILDELEKMLTDKLLFEGKEKGLRKHV